MTPGSVLTISHYRPHHAPDIRRRLLDVYAEVYAAEAAEDPFFSLPAFTRRLDRHTSHPGWACVIGTVGADTVGYAYGRPDSESDWADVTDTIEDVAAFAEGTFGLCEIMVRQAWRGTGIARTLHDELMNGRAETRASLLVEETHPRVRQTYQRWGYRVVGHLQPVSDAPLYHAMILKLR
ncbi:Acetyltransferase (GNAT) domain-containing protein [Actinacidiphila yanglinensis]|uniref:Acetyltransferase (GNAT) domain-containing protein n=1 Tax=Actinacidiphila yanglinensis TaxID=310779 RepID=A0A1H6DKP6_9ACTN|nr:GNAT family N-acetyltransferase [Actinacidiphila yanglinensis]SEG85808.1 Acetyltransferase (GNAT) domain-containing protein [Actinacidiphila yanglinensis]